jgi:hypothetical protein
MQYNYTYSDHIIRGLCSVAKEELSLLAFVVKVKIELRGRNAVRRARVTQRTHRYICNIINRILDVMYSKIFYITASTMLFIAVL